MNKGYIQVVFLFLSLFLYVNNKVLATEPKEAIVAIHQYAKRSNARRNAVLMKTISPSIFASEIYEQNKDLLCTNHDEARKAAEFMEKVVAQFLCYTNNKDDYVLSRKYDNDAFLYLMRHENHTNIEKLNIKFHNPNKYDEIINTLWNPNGNKSFGYTYINEKVARVYNPNLIMVQHRLRSDTVSLQGYFYALAIKLELSHGVTVIVYASANINDHNRLNQKPHRNPVLEDTESFTAEIDSESDIRNGQITKFFVNISGYLIKKKDNYVDLTYLNSMDCLDYNAPTFIIDIIEVAKHFFLMRLRDDIVTK
ncbi:hypothetical protein YYC_05492 [Plasmodium yoelii 17X]|uniref:Fam-a protein n=1 Tax=Plasmodium yoelii 17X TaxID=1323249 RepID=V7PD53_PLAYE|nr:hypothetical protein YYC_05492 [Plasmodium yoelii 17X]